jgi:hypothetical protein
MRGEPTCSPRSFPVIVDLSSVNVVPLVTSMPSNALFVTTSRSSRISVPPEPMLTPSPPLPSIVESNRWNPELPEATCSPVEPLFEIVALVAVTT